MSINDKSTCKFNAVILPSKLGRLTLSYNWKKTVQQSASPVARAHILGNDAMDVMCVTKYPVLHHGQAGTELVLLRPGL